MYISQGSVAMSLRFGGFFNGCSMTSLPLSLMVKNFWNWSTIFATLWATVWCPAFGLAG